MTLLDKLTMMKKFVCNESHTIRNLKNFHFTNGHLECSNGQLYAITPLDLNIDGCINPNVLCNTVKSFKDEPLKFVDNKDHIAIEDGNSHVKINKEEGDYPEHEFPDDEWKSFPKETWDKIKECSKTMIHGVVVSDRVMGSDGIRLCITDNGDNNDNPIIIDSLLLEILSTIEGSPESYYMNEDEIFFKWSDDTIFSGMCLNKESHYYRKLMHLYDNADNYINDTKEDGIQFTLNESWKDMLNRCSIFSDKYISVHKTRSRVVFNVSNYLGAVEESMDIEEDSDPCNFEVDLKCLQELLKFSNTITHSPSKNYLLAENDGFTKLLVCASKTE